MQLIQALWRGVEIDSKLCVYAVQDGAASSRIYPNLKASRLDSACLYAGNIPESLAEAAPHVVRLLRRSLYTPWLLREGWGEAWGIYLHTHASLQAVRLHLQRLLHVTSSQGQSHLFRFFDPRILRQYLPLFSPQELRVFFGPVQSYFAESETGGALMAFSMQDQALHIQSIAITETAAAVPTP